MLLSQKLRSPQTSKGEERGGEGTGQSRREGQRGGERNRFSLLVSTAQRVSTAPSLALLPARPAEDVGPGPGQRSRASSLPLDRQSLEPRGALCVNEGCFQLRSSVSVSYTLRSSLQPPGELAPSLAGRERKGSRGLFGKRYSRAGVTRNVHSFGFSLRSGILRGQRARVLQGGVLLPCMLCA